VSGHDSTKIYQKSEGLKMAFFESHVRSDVLGEIHVTLQCFNVYDFAQAIRRVSEQLQKALEEQFPGAVPMLSSIEDGRDSCDYQGGWWPVPTRNTTS
jgi:hypothetical protein